MGADYIECDVQITKDLQLVCSHESWINEVCNVEDHTEFSNRIRYDLKYLKFFLMVLKWVLNLKLVWRTRSTMYLIFSDLTILMMTIQILIGMIKGLSKIIILLLTLPWKN